MFIYYFFVIVIFNVLISAINNAFTFTVFSMVSLSLYIGSLKALDLIGSFFLVVLLFGLSERFAWAVRVKDSQRPN